MSHSRLKNHLKRHRRGAIAACVVATTAGVVVATAGLAYGDSAVDQVRWSSCRVNSPASLSFAVGSVDWPNATALRYRFTLSPDCPTDTNVAIVEKTPQSNDNAQTLPVPGAAGGTFSGNLAVRPLRTMPWSIVVYGALGAAEIATTNIEVKQPQPPLANAQGTFTVTANTIDQRRQFVQAVGTPGTKVTIAGNVDLDLTGLNGIVVAPNVQILGDRSVNPLGPRVFTNTEPANLFDVPPSRGSHERISGIRLQGGSSADPFDNMGREDSNAIRIRKADVEVDHNEINLWRGAAVGVLDCDDCSTPSNLMARASARSVWIHDNYIHHNQHPTGDVGGGHGGGYGVSVDHGGYAVVERNVFDYNRHSMMGGGGAGDGYLFYDNLILPHGGVNSRISHTHAIDMHGTIECSVLGIDIAGDHECGVAGEYMDIQYNTVWFGAAPAVKLRGVPTDRMDVRHNAFIHCALWAPPTTSCATRETALIQTQHGLQQSDNTLGVPLGGDARTNCDFDGDAVNDTFHATGVALWFESTRLAGRYVFLGRSPATGGRLQLDDRNNDGLCDVTADGTAGLTDPAVTIGPAVGTVPFLVGSRESDVGGFITSAGLTAGTVTYAHNQARAGTVVDQSPHWGYAKPAGWPVNIVVSTGEVTVPNVLSFGQAAALNAITSIGLTVGAISNVNNCADPGTVQTQNPSGGTLASPGTAVRLSVSTCTHNGGNGGNGGDDPPPNRL